MPETKETAVISSDILQALIRAQKAFKMYPPNNPMYGKAIDETLRLIEEYLSGHESLSLRFTANEIHLDSKVVYKNASRQDNYALFFYRDGIRELSFLPGITREEIQNFLSVTARDFERSLIDDDVVTLLWERDFEHITYLATSEFLLEEDYDPKLETPSARTLTETDKRLQEAYHEALDSQAVVFETRDIARLTEEDLTILEKLREKEETYSPLASVVEVLFELFRQARSPDDIELTGRFLRESLEQALRQADFETAARILGGTNTLIESGTLPVTHTPLARKVAEGASDPDAIREMGEILDSGVPVNEGALSLCGGFFPPSAVMPLLGLLGTLQNMHGRRLVIELLASVGRKDLATLTKGLKDSRWFVVRNTLCVLGRIADVKSVDTLGQCVTHADTRVRKEAFRTLGAIGGTRVIPHLKKGFADADPGVRVAAIKAFRGQQDSEIALKIVMAEIIDKNFGAKGFEEKKEFFQILAQWESVDVLEYLKKTLDQKSLFGRARNEELRACAAHAMGFSRKGLIFLADLERAADSGSAVLRAEARNAIKRIKAHG